MRQLLAALVCILTLAVSGHLTLKTSNHVHRLVSTIKGEIEADNYSHYHLSERGNFKLVLVSLEGDADLYVASSDKHHNADYSNYEAQSITYGNDEIFIPNDMKRPVSISVYAHPYYVKARYVLSIYLYSRVDADVAAVSDQTTEDISYSDYLNTYLSNSYFDKEDLAYGRAGAEHGVDVPQFNKMKSEQRAAAARDNYANADTDDDDSDDDNESGGGASFVWTIVFRLLELVAEVLL